MSRFAIRTMDFDRIASSAPLDATASAVRDGSGDLYDGPNLGDRQHWKAPPLPLALKPLHLADLTGRRVGERLTVVRFHGQSGKSTPVNVWLVRCDCGDYEVRQDKKIRNGGHPEDACAICAHARVLRERAARTSTRKSRELSAAALDRIVSRGSTRR